ncbi:MAG: leucyl aminopeptidase [Desulfurococcales archaeon ex4484_58]|nr:MAG: leucyl aminopeptidase [Desulfurococcales archaeon ex4484_58]
MVKLNYRVHIGDPVEAGVDSLIILIPRDQEKPLIPSDAEQLFEGMISRVVELEKFRGDVNETLMFYPIDKPIKRVVLSGLGERPGLEEVRVAIGNAINLLSQKKAVRIGVCLRNLLDDFDIGDLIFNVVTTIESTLYDPSEWFKSEKNEVSLKEAILLIDREGDYSEFVRRAVIVGDALNYARRIADTPSSIMNPEKIEEEARKLAEEYGLGIKVFHVEDLEKNGLNAILAVGRGGGVSPRLIVLEYRGRGGGDWDYGFIGKTVTFDAGGLDLKSAEGMSDMKYDKSGGASVLGIMKAVAELKLPYNIVAGIPVVENLPGPKAYKPRDIIKMYNGLTVEIGNTDAEGRLILADTLAYIDKNYKPKTIIDLATLTGAIVVALGNYAAGLFTENDKLANKLYELGWRIGERVWRMPLWREYYDQLKSEIADINNIGGRAAGAITAAAFLSKFVSDKSRWVHLDIAGTAWVQRGHPRKPYYKQVAIGYGVKLLVSLLLEELKKK